MKIPAFGSDFKVIYQYGEEWIEYNKYITLTEAEEKVKELNKKGLQAKVVDNIVTEREVEVPKTAVKDGPY